MSIVKILSGAALASAALLVAPAATHAATFTSLYTFTGGNDGSSPFGRLTLRYNEIFGAAYDDGASGDGVLFTTNPVTGGETVIHSFTGPDGAQPFAHMTLEKKTLYGTTAFGGANNAGTIYKLNPKTNAEIQLYAFTGNADGKNVVAGTVFYDNALWGTTYTAGANNYGTLFKFDLATNTETTLHAFASGTDGEGALANPIVVKGVLYGVTFYGGANGAGTIYSYDTAKNVYKTIYTFTGGADGAHPVGELFFSGGTFYGTAQNGGASGNGDVFSFNPKTGALTTLYTFSGAADGATPVGSLTELKGVLYGTAETGGANGYGTVYGINPTTGAETTLYSFTNGADGAHPWAGMIVRGGALYGTTIGMRSGASYGSVFKIVP